MSEHHVPGTELHTYKPQLIVSINSRFLLMTKRGQKVPLFV
ncbi:hypothetical protein [Bacillus cereus]|nr:hypothetical protein [Bacillus cereus]